MATLPWHIPVASGSDDEAQIYQDQVIRKDTIWNGEIIVKGVVVVARGATLQITPGTRVRFLKTDRNNDGIGDSEIRVLGRILAEGTPDARITFASAEESPSWKDWSYLLVFTSGSFNRVAYCNFQHAFSGLQVHFSTVSVKNSQFEGNFEGVRFGRADLALENNVFRDNDVGIRFTRMEGPVLISNNEITRNRIGIFLVPSGQNIRDFFEPDRSGRAWNTGRLKIAGNNIYGNDWYNLSLGEKQLWNIEVSKNYWGSNSATEIEEKIFDQRRDSSLGKAFYEPFLKKRHTLATGAGD